MMKYLILLAFYTTSLLTYSENLKTPHIKVIGTAAIQVEPNMMHWSLHVKNIDLNLEQCAHEHSLLVHNILNFLKITGINEKNIQTTRMVFGENYVYKNRQNIKQGYYSSTDITFTAKTLSSYQKLWKGLSRFENASIQNVHFDHSDREKLQNQAKVKALNNAKIKAQTLVKVFQSKIGKPLFIGENSSSSSFTHRDRFKTLAQEGVSDIDTVNHLSPGKITINADMHVIFEIQ